MLELRHFENSDNLRPLKAVDQGFGRAAVRFVGMLADGSAFVPMARKRIEWAGVERFNPAKEFPSDSIRSARHSFWRAPQQFVKGNLTLPEYNEIMVRCKAVIAKESDR